MLTPAKTPVAHPMAASTTMTLAAFPTPDPFDDFHCHLLELVSMLTSTAKRPMVKWQDAAAVASFPYTTALAIAIDDMNHGRHIKPPFEVEANSYAVNSWREGAMRLPMTMALVRNIRMSERFTVRVLPVIRSRTWLLSLTVPPFSYLHDLKVQFPLKLE